MLTDSLRKVEFSLSLLQLEVFSSIEMQWSYVMGIGTTDRPPQTAAEWNHGSCDVMAVALKRMYGLPMMAEFEWGYEGRKKVLNYLVHAWVRLPDGRALDASGPQPMFEPIEGGDPNDPWVEGYKIIELTDRNSHLLWIREEDNYVDSIREMEAPQWIWRNLSPMLSELGLEPLRYRRLLGLPPLEPAKNEESDYGAVSAATPAMGM